MRLFKRIEDVNREKYIVPKGVQDVISIQKIFEDGIFLVETNKYSKSYKFTDINYAVASKEDKEAMFLKYSEVLNGFDTSATTKITVNNHYINKKDFEKNMLLDYVNDELDNYRKEYNNMLLNKVSQFNNIIQEKYITITINKSSLEEARNYFNRTEIELSSRVKESITHIKDYYEEKRDDHTLLYF